MIFIQKLSSGVYASDENNVVGLIKTTTDSEYKPKAYTTDEDVVNNMGDDMLEAMVPKMVRYVMTIILAVGGNMKLMMTLTLCLMPLQKNRDYIFIYMDI